MKDSSEMAYQLSINIFYLLKSNLSKRQRKNLSIYVKTAKLFINLNCMAVLAK